MSCCLLHFWVTLPVNSRQGYGQPLVIFWNHQHRPCMIRQLRMGRVECLWDLRSSRVLTGARGGLAEQRNCCWLVPVLPPVRHWGTRGLNSSVNTMLDENGKLVCLLYQACTSPEVCKFKPRLVSQLRTNNFLSQDTVVTSLNASPLSHPQNHMEVVFLLPILPGLSGIA